MLKWCSYCQHFLGEVPEYEDLVITHGMCTECHPKVFNFTESDFTHAELLKRIQRKLFDAGQRNDLTEAENIIEDAVKANIRPVDILIGLIAPMLYQIGEDWKKGILSVEAEHRFTAFCEKTFDLVAPKVTGGIPANLTQSNETDVLLMNAPGNEHTLAVRILALWLISMGMRAQIADAHRNLGELVELIKSIRPKMLLISVALAEQYTNVRAIVERIAELPQSIRPKIIIGGNAVKLDLIPPIPGADLMADISSLSESMSSL